MNIFTQPFSADTPGMQGASGGNQFVFQSSSASISNMIAAAHHQEGNLQTETTDNGTDGGGDNNLT
jgi:hypothetical protein